MSRFDLKAARLAWDDWRNNGNHSSTFGDDAPPKYDDESGVDQRLLDQHEGFAAFRAGMRYGRTGDPFGPFK